MAENMDFDFEYDRFMEQTEDVTGDPEAEAEARKNMDDYFRIDNDQKAEWALNKIRECDAELQKWVDFYQSKIDSYKKYCEIRRGFFEHLLSQYFQTVPKKETKTQSSYSLPSGKLVLKRQGPEFEKDEGTVLDWLDKQPDGKNYIKIKETLDWSGLKKVLTIAGGRMVTEDGEIVPGITVTERPDVFKVEVK